MFVISFCQIYAFNPDLNFDKIVIFWSFQQTEDEICVLNHFSEEHVKYFDKVSFKQLKDSITNVLNKVKSTSLSEMFSTELKFIIDVLVKWFNGVFKFRFNELDEVKKQKFSRENPIDCSNEKCVICDLKLSVSLNDGYEKTEKTTAWYDFLVQKEHLFLRNIYSYEDLKKSENISALQNITMPLTIFFDIVVLLNRYYNKNSNVVDVEHDIMETFLDTTLVSI